MLSQIQIFFLITALSILLIPRSIRAVSQAGIASNNSSAHFAGTPVAPEIPADNLIILTNKGFIVGYDETRKAPAWVAYRLFNVKPNPAIKRRTRFNTDLRTRARVAESEYRGSDYARGHMAPAYAITVCYGNDGQKDSFLMSNIVPQDDRLNSGPWRTLEMKIIQEYVPACKDIWVITGPVFNKKVERLKTGPEIPDAFFKILIDDQDGTTRVLAFLMSQNARSSDLTQYLTSIDKIEQVTGLDFLSKLPDKQENQLESTVPSTLW